MSYYKDYQEFVRENVRLGPQSFAEELLEAELGLYPLEDTPCKEQTRTPKKPRKPKR